MGVLKGAFVFLADLVRQLQTPVPGIEFMAPVQLWLGYREFGDGQGSVRDTAPQSDLPSRQHVTASKKTLWIRGRSTSTALELLGAKEPASLELVALLDKPDPARVSRATSIIWG